MWSSSLSTDTSGIQLQTEYRMQNTSWEQTGVPEQRKRIHRTTQNSVGQGARGKTGVLVALDLPSARGGELKQGSDPHSGATV